MPDSIEGVCAVVLAAGQGSRYREHRDEDKLLSPSTDAPDASPVLAETLSALSGVAEWLLVVARDDNQRLLAWLNQIGEGLGAEILSVRSNGLGHSLAQAVAHRSARRGWLVALGDMPYVRRESIARIAAAIQPQRLVVPTYRGQRGHPRGIGAHYLDQLLMLGDDRGAQGLFVDSQVIEIELDDPGVLQDIDRPGDRRPG
uniref:nucleotidyltransferase family protein n=1 Tax=Pseudomonas sp. SST3 TaxID=2267882 RepID=UPI0031391A38